MNKLVFILLSVVWPVPAQQLSLNGEWEFGNNRVYTGTTIVPGFPSAGDKANEETLWYKKNILLPAGCRPQATLILKGARFNPRVYVNGELVSEQEGGMAPTTHYLGKLGNAGDTVTLEIALLSMNEMNDSNASTVPKADRWRTNMASGLWDDVDLYFHDETRIASVIPACYPEKNAWFYITKSNLMQ